MSTYPPQLILVIRERCAEFDRRRHSKAPPLPADPALEVLLETAYHASFLSEEGRRPGFRIIYLPPDKRFSDPDPRYYVNDFRRLPFDHSRPYTAVEVNRLAPAAELTRLMLCVHNYSETHEHPELFIWGMLDVGENWWKFVHHETSGGRPPPKALTITSLSPGEIIISTQGEVLASLRNGDIQYPEYNALWSGPASDFFLPARTALYDAAVNRLHAQRWDESGNDDNYPHRLYVMFLERILFSILQKRHGGALLLIPNQISKSDTRITDHLLIKYPCEYDYAWEILVQSLLNLRRYNALHVPLWNGTTKMTQENFQKYSILSSEDEELDEGMKDAAQAIASLTSVDGAVLLNDRFAVLGFGAEVTAISPLLSEVAVQVSGQNVRIPIESFGTRHRSVFRFCSSFDQSVGFVVSQDGGIKAVKRVGSDVLLWPDINTGAMGI